MLSLSGFLTVFLYVLLYLPYVKKRKIDLNKWQEQIPKSIQLATLFGVIAFFAMCVMMWPAYRVVSPLMVLNVWIGSVAFIALF